MPLTGPETPLTPGQTKATGEGSGSDAIGLWQQLRGQFFSQGLGGSTDVDMVGRTLGYAGPIPESQAMGMLWDRELRPNPGESAADWWARVDARMSGADFLNSGINGAAQLQEKWNKFKSDPTFKQTLGQFVTTDKAGNLIPVDKAAQPGAGTGGADSSWQQKIQAFYQEMMKPIDPNDPYLQRIVQVGQTQGLAGATGRGVEGGLANAAMQQGGVHAGLDYAQGENARRQGLAAQALGLGSNNELGLGGLQLQAKQLQYQADVNRLQAAQRPNPLMAGLGGAAQWGSMGAMTGNPYIAGGAAIVGGVTSYLGAQNARPTQAPSANFMSGPGLHNA